MMRFWPQVFSTRLHRSRTPNLPPPNPISFILTCPLLKNPPPPNLSNPPSNALWKSQRVVATKCKKRLAYAFAMGVFVISQPLSGFHKLFFDHDPPGGGTAYGKGSSAFSQPAAAGTHIKTKTSTLIPKRPHQPIPYPTLILLHTSLNPHTPISPVPFLPRPGIYTIEGMQNRGFEAVGVFWEMLLPRYLVVFLGLGVLFLLDLKTGDCAGSFECLW